MTEPHLDSTPSSHPRTQAALQRLRQAMRAIEADIEQHKGTYPYNHGRVTQSELCRRADVKKATLQNPVHKSSTRVEIMQWLDALNTQLTQTRHERREHTADDTNRTALDSARQQIQQLERDNALLRGGSAVPTWPGCPPLAIGSTLRHYKGGLYRVLAYCLIEATLQPGVLYRPLQGDMQDTLWLRPLAQFHDEVSTSAGVVKRFTTVDHPAPEESTAP